jgi:hypothetical protein
MFCLTVAVGNIPWALMFKTEEAAIAAGQELNVCFEGNDQHLATLVDDFGQTLRVGAVALHGWMLEDMDKSKLAHIERALHHARMQQEGQKLAAADATLRAGQHGPSIVSPMGMPNGFPKQ